MTPAKAQVSRTQKQDKIRAPPRNAVKGIDDEGECPQLDVQPNINFATERGSPPCQQRSAGIGETAGVRWAAAKKRHGQRKVGANGINGRTLQGALRNLGFGGGRTGGPYRVDGAGNCKAFAFVGHSLTAPNSDAEAGETAGSGSLHWGSFCETSDAEQYLGSADANAGGSEPH